jgi:hypothetical protein
MMLVPWGEDAVVDERAPDDDDLATPSIHIYTHIRWYQAI